MKTKVLFIITKGNFGGAQRYVYDLATGLPKTKFDTMVACGEGEELPKLLETQGIKTIKITRLIREIKFFDEFKVCGELIKIIRAEKPDAVHLNSSKIGGIGAVATRIASVLEKNYSPRVIFTSHGWGFYEKHRSQLMHIFYYLSHWITVMLCNKTIAVSEKTKKDMAWLPFMGKKIIVIHNGIEEFEIAEKEEARNFLVGDKAEAAKDKLVIYSISELHRNKGLDVGLKGISLLPKEMKEKIFYSIAGSGEEKDNLEKKAEELGLKEQVMFLGFIPDARKYLRGADIFLFPSRTENLPFAILEAGFASLPIIATSVGGIPEIITDMKDGILVHKENSKEIREAIIYMIHNPERMQEFSAAIKKNITKNFSKNKMIKETARVLQ